MKTPTPIMTATTNLPLLVQIARADTVANALRVAHQEALLAPHAGGDDLPAVVLWLTGRAEEVLAYAREVDADVRAERLSEPDGSNELARFLERVEQGLACRSAPARQTDFASRYDTAPAAPEEAHAFAPR
jgi:hypothetical protein